MKVKTILIIIALGLVTDVTSLRAQPNHDYQKARKEMVRYQIIARDIEDSDIISAMEKVPRHLFVPEDIRIYAYGDHPLPIGEGQTISQPYIVGLMTQLLNLKKGMKVLEIGTGSGYQAVILAEMGIEVYTIEIVEILGRRAEKLIDSLGYKNIRVRIGDGYEGWPSEALFDRIIVTCAPTKVPVPLTEQLREGGLMVIPVGERSVQQLVVLRKIKGRLTKRVVAPVLFVPMVGPQGIKY